MKQLLGKAQSGPDVVASLSVSATACIHTYKHGTIRKFDLWSLADAIHGRESPALFEPWSILHCITSGARSWIRHAIPRDILPGGHLRIGSCSRQDCGRFPDGKLYTEGKCTSCRSAIIPECLACMPQRSGIYLGNPNGYPTVSLIRWTLPLLWPYPNSQVPGASANGFT